MSADLDLERLDALVAQPWSRVLVADEDGRFVASVPELEGCFADGDTPQDALNALDEVLRDWLEIALEEETSLPEPRRLDHAEPSGRFSVRVPRSLHRRLTETAEHEGSSLNQLVNILLTRALERPAREKGHAVTREEVHEDLTALAVRSGPQSIGPLKGIARFVRDRGDVHVACLLYVLASVRIEKSEGRQAASRELGMAAALARRHGSNELAEALLRESLHNDPTNLRSFSALGQLLHHRGRYEEAAECLERAAGVDNYAKLFLGWSRLLAGLEADDDESVADGSSKLTEALRQWAYENHDTSDRASWTRQVQRLRGLGSRFAEQASQLVEFANANASWGDIDPDIADEPWSREDADLLVDEPPGSYSEGAAARPK
jgi:antitoxin HicB